LCKPSIKKTQWKEAEDMAIVKGYEIHGSNWAQIAQLLPGRNYNAVKNRFRSALQKRLHKNHNGELILLPSTARKYVRKAQTRRPASYAVSTPCPPLPPPPRQSPPTEKSQSERLKSELSPFSVFNMKQPSTDSDETDGSELEME
jgi:hypothetical protein